MAKKNFGVIGLGKFGTSAALTLAQEGKRIILVDLDFQAAQNRAADDFRVLPRPAHRISPFGVGRFSARRGDGLVNFYFETLRTPLKDIHLCAIWSVNFLSAPRFVQRLFCGL